MTLGEAELPTVHLQFPEAVFWITVVSCAASTLVPVSYISNDICVWENHSLVLDNWEQKTKKPPKTQMPNTFWDLISPLRYPSTLPTVLLIMPQFLPSKIKRWVQLPCPATRQVSLAGSQQCVQVLRQTPLWDRLQSLGLLTRSQSLTLPKLLPT